MTHSGKAPQWGLLILEAYLKQQIIFPDSPLFNYSSHFSWRPGKQKHSTQPMHCCFFCSNSAITMFGVSREGSNSSGIFTAALQVSSVQNVLFIMNDFNEKMGKKPAKTFKNLLGFKSLRK